MAETSWFTIAKMAWDRAVGFLPDWILKKAYPPSKMKERILIFSIGGSSGGPQLYVTPGKSLGIETNEIVVVNLLPFPIDFENVHAEILLGGVQLASKEANISRPIRRMASETINLRFELSDNQAGIARDYFQDSPLLQMGILANFRTRFGLLTLSCDVRIRAIVYKKSGAA